MIYIGSHIRITLLHTCIGKCQHISWQTSYLALLYSLLLLVKRTIILFCEGTKPIWHSKPGLHSEGEVQLFQVGWVTVLYKIWLQSRRTPPSSFWTFACLRKLVFLERGKLLSSSSLWDLWLSKVIKYERESTSLCVCYRKCWDEKQYWFSGLWKRVAWFFLHAMVIPWMWWVTVVWKPRKANLQKITGEGIFGYYRLMVSANCFAGRFVSDSCSLTAWFPPPSQEEVVATTLQV